MTLCDISLKATLKGNQPIFYSFISVYGFLTLCVLIKLVRLICVSGNNIVVTKLKEYSFILLISSSGKSYTGRLLSVVFFNNDLFSDIFRSICSPALYTGFYFTWIFISTYLEFIFHRKTHRKIKTLQIFFSVTFIFLSIIYDFGKFLFFFTGFEFSPFGRYSKIAYTILYRTIFLYSICFISFQNLMKFIKTEYFDDYCLKLLERIKKIFFYFSFTFIISNILQSSFIAFVCETKSNNDYYSITYFIIFDIWPIAGLLLYPYKINYKRTMNTNSMTDLFSRKSSNDYFCSVNE